MQFPEWWEWELDLSPHERGGGRRDRLSSMSQRELKVSYHRGKPIAAYLYLKARPIHSAQSREVAPGLIIDYSDTGEAIGVEIVDPRSLQIEELSAVLESLGEDDLQEDELDALKAVEAARKR